MESRKIKRLFSGLIGSSALLLIGSDGKIGEFNTYALLVILATLCYGTGVNFIKARLHGIKATVTSSTSLLFTLPFGLFYLIFDGFFGKVADSPGMIESSLYIIILGTLGTAIALMLFYKLVELSNPLTASSVTYLIPFVAVLWGVFDGERLFLMHYLSLAVIISGVFIINRAK
jgi:drug/metabolite transporter (DMT)-like permease